RDLVGRLIQDESEIWNRLLNNSFCQKMKTAASDNVAVTKGFKWYMVQDFLYCARLMLFDTERSTKAPNKANYTSLAQRIKDDTDYAVSLLTTCIQNLSIPEATVLQTKREWEVNLYTDFTINVVENFDWVVSLVSMIPCIQVSTHLRVLQQIARKSTINCHSHTITLRISCKPTQLTKVPPMFRTSYILFADLRCRYSLVQQLGLAE
ncbi:hypothetical protein BC826DRAFT_906870, partial [Russula brevipes]